MCSRVQHAEVMVSNRADADEVVLVEAERHDLVADGALDLDRLEVDIL